MLTLVPEPIHHRRIKAAPDSIFKCKVVVINHGPSEAKNVMVTATVSTEPIAPLKVYKRSFKPSDVWIQQSVPDSIASLGPLTNGETRELSFDVLAPPGG